MHGPRTLGAALVAVTAGCAIHPPRTDPLARGCYEVVVSGWNDEVARAVGLSSLPSVMVLDTLHSPHGAWLALVPVEWKHQGSATYTASWSTGTGRWMRLPGDTIIRLRGGPDAMHDFHGDSILVTWSGWGGRVTAYLEAVGDGYRGLGQLHPRPLAKGVANPLVTLSRRSCEDLSGHRLADDR